MEVHVIYATNHRMLSWLRGQFKILGHEPLCYQEDVRGCQVAADTSVGFFSGEEAVFGLLRELHEARGLTDKAIDENVEPA